MRDLMKSSRKLMAVFILTIMGMSSVGLAVGVVAGRDFSRCVRSCNSTRLACFNGCTDDCRDLYPGTPNKPQRDACILASKDVCEVESDDCKLACQAIKPPPTEECP
jgi:hypothetical protein